MVDAVIVHGDGRGASVDDKTKAVVFIQSDHHEVHEGESFVVSGQTSLGSAETLKILIVTAAKEAHLEIFARSSGETNYKLYESPTYSAAGSATTEVNRNRGSSETATVVVTTAPTTSANGTQLYESHWGASVRSGGEERGLNEWVLAANTAYMILITSEAAGNDVSYVLDWYEETI